MADLDEVKGELGDKKEVEKKEVVISECPVQAVIVYADRAEVTRVVKVKLGAGEREVVLKNLSKSLDKDSVRVDGIGPASITEVSSQEISVTEEADTEANASEEVKELKQKVAELQREISLLKDRQERVSAQTNLLTNYSDGLFAAGKSANTADLLDDKTIDGIFEYLDTYEDKALKLKRARHEGEQSMAKLESELKEARTKLGKLEPTLDQPPKVIQQQVIGILLAVEKEAEIQLLVSYVVSNASWRPKYDLRVSSAERTMQVSYFGMVKQNTGEDWVDAKLSLSTAAPSIGGSVPTLDTCKLTLIPNVYPKRRGSFSKKTRQSYGYGEGSKEIVAAQAQVSEGLSSSVFEISVPANIPADSSGHKVHVATVELKPTFEYDTVPKLAQHAFLRAKVTNDSSYPFLAGPANVFLDQSYVTETTLSSTSPREEFSCSLGVDPSVKVVYKPVKRFREESGIINKNVTYTYKQVTEISNTRAEPAVVTFKDQIPLSEDEKLKVTLTEPVIGKQKQGAPPPNPKLNASNNIEWRLELKPEETRAITIQYTVEFPAHKQVEGL